MQEEGRSGILARLSSEDWREMTRAARESPNHVANLARWEKIARQLNPHLDDDQVARLAEKLKLAHYRKMGRISAENRRARKESKE